VPPRRHAVSPTECATGRQLSSTAPCTVRRAGPLCSDHPLPDTILDPSPALNDPSYFADIGLILFAFFLVQLHGFFVAAELAMVKLRATKVEAIAKQHGWRGHILRKVHDQLDAYLSACQLGITLASL